MSYEQTNLRCRNCRFWWPLVDAEQSVDHARTQAARGQCRCHAPPASGADQGWAIVRCDDWCGVHSHVSI
jgi:hypothetical protein